MTDRQTEDSQHQQPETEGQVFRKNRRARSIALALALLGFAVIFYVLTIAKMGPGLFDRAL